MVDEPEAHRGDFIYIVSLGADLNDIQVRKVQDWTGLCRTEQVNQVNCMLDKKDVLYLSVENEINAILLSSLVAENVAQGQDQKLTAGPNTCKGRADLREVGLEYASVTNFRCLCLYDSEASYKKDDDSVIAIIDNMARLDFNKIIST